LVTFKIIVTVRDYALDEVREICRSVGCDEIVIVPFSDEEIKKFLQVEFKIDFIDE
jgi:CheY-like chemotaxis protein